MTRRASSLVASLIGCVVGCSTGAGRGEPDAGDVPANPGVVLQEICREQGHEVHDCPEVDGGYFVVENCAGYLPDRRRFVAAWRDWEPPGIDYGLPPAEAAPCWYCACPEGTWWAGFLGCIACENPTIDCATLRRFAPLTHSCTVDDDCVGLGSDLCGDCLSTTNRYLAWGDWDGVDHAISLGACDALEILCDGCFFATESGYGGGGWPGDCVDGRCRAHRGPWP